MKQSTRTLGGGLVVAVLTGGVFAWGMHLGRPAGHDLLRSSLASGRAPVGGTLVALKGRVAQDGGMNGGGMSGPDARDPADAGDSDKPGAIFQDVYAKLRRFFVDPQPTDTQIAHGAASAMLASLQDTDSRFLEPADMAELTGEARGEYHGLGAALAVRKVAHAKDPKDATSLAYTEMRLTVVAPLPGSPAQKAGLRPGDYITEVNGQGLADIFDDKGQPDLVVLHLKDLKAAQDDPVTFNKLVASLEKAETDALPLAQAEARLASAGPKPLTLTVMRPGSPQPLHVTADVSAPTDVTPVEARTLSGGIGYIKIPEFSDGAGGKFDAALGALSPGGLKGLILDLRDCPGGLRDVGAAVAARLTTGTTLGVLETKGRKQTPLAIVPSRQIACPLAVLVNGGTANVAELVASALQTNGGKLIGTQTFGDASEVKPVALRDGSGLTVRVGRLLTARGKEFAGVGLTPDAVVADAPGGDAPLARAVAMLSGQIARR